MPGPSLSSVRVEAVDSDSLFDDHAVPVHPHTQRMLRPALAQYLELSTREHPRSPGVEIVIALRGSVLPADSEERLGQQVARFFHEERQLVELELRVNRVEGRGSFRFGLPYVLVALAIAGGLYLELPDLLSTRLIAFVTALFYLVFITIVWVLLWDPIEKLLFDGYFLRQRRTALAKLGAAPVRFEYVGPPGSVV